MNAWPQPQNLYKNVLSKIILILRSKLLAMSFFLIIFLIWMAIWLFTTGITISKKLPYYKLAYKNSAVSFRKTHSIYDENSRDYFSILDFCNQYVSADETIQLILPKEDVNKYEYLRDKGRYLLYPKNFGNNDIYSPNILIYDVKNIVIHSDYKKQIEFSQHKSLFVKRE